MLANLVEYARQQGIEAEAGFIPKTVRWLIVFDENGRFLEVVDQADPEDKRSRGRTFPKAPHLKFSGDTPMRQFLVDTAQYALLLGETEPSEKLLVKHKYFVNLLREAAADPVFGVLADALADEATRQLICEHLADPSHRAKPADSVSFAVTKDDRVRILVEESVWHDWWRGYFPTLFTKKKQDGGQMRCLVSGALTEPARTHPKIKGLGGVGGKVETTLVAFNERAFCSYGLEQSHNAAVSKEVAQQYAAGLNDLIDRSVTMAGTKVAYWYVGVEKVEAEDDVLREVFQGVDLGDAEVKEESPEGNAPSPRTRAQAHSKARALLEAIRTGKRPDLEKCRFNALTLSGNSARVVIRDWMEGQFEELAENVDAWFSDLTIVRRDGSDLVRSHKFGAVLAAPVRELKDVAAPLVAALWRAAVKRQAMPHKVMVQTLARTKIDIIQGQAASHARFGVLKAYCIRKGIGMRATLDESLKDPAYLSGRIMALLADIQQAALPDVGAGVVQRYYAAASATPALVLGRLVRQAQIGHLPKIDSEGLRFWFDKQLAEVWELLPQAPPSVLSLEEQTLFAMGYYKQKAKRFAKKDDANKDRGQSE